MFCIVVTLSRRLSKKCHYNDRLLAIDPSDGSPSLVLVINPPDLVRAVPINLAKSYVSIRARQMLKLMHPYGACLLSKIANPRNETINN